MKKIFHTLLLLVLTTAIIMAQSDATKKISKKEMKKEMEQVEQVTGAQINFESKIVDYGEIEKGSDPLRKFAFVNDGTEPLVIKTAKGSCGCTVPDYPREPILPGESGVIDVRYDTNRMGQFQKTVTLSTNVSDQKIVLTIKGKVNQVAKEESVPVKEGSIF